MEYNCRSSETSRSENNAIPQASQGKSVWNFSVLVHPWTASIKDSSTETCARWIQKVASFSSEIVKNHQ